MHPTLRVGVASAHVHKPLIHFIGKRQWPANPESPHPHPAGPPEYKAHFAEFLKKFQSSASQPQPQPQPQSQPQSQSQSQSRFEGATSKPQKASEDADVYQEFWQAPSRLWNSRVRNISEEEMDAILSGGASLH